MDAMHDLQGETLHGIEDVEANKRRENQTKSEVVDWRSFGDAVFGPALAADIWTILNRTNLRCF